MNSIHLNDFIFSRRYRIWRHLLFWTLNTFLFSVLFMNRDSNFSRNLFNMIVWLPLTMLYCYPLLYFIVPRYLLKGNFAAFGLIIFLWVLAGYFLNFLFRYYIFIPVQEWMNYKPIVKNPWAPASLLAVYITAVMVILVAVFKYWVQKQQDWLRSEKERITAELQLLKAQVHPHFLFNTLNNIYSFSLESSPKTPGLILKLSSLLSYMLYDCNAELVQLEKEISVMKDYIDLEKERYGNKIEISWSIEGDAENKSIAPLLMLPFLENAFKHGTSDQVEKPWLSVDISIRQHTLRCKIVNSKNINQPYRNNGIGIQNVKKRLSILYPEKHELKMNDEENFFVVSLLMELSSENGIKKSTSQLAAEKVSS